MTEYDYSPEAYERYLATQTRIANWAQRVSQEVQSPSTGSPSSSRNASRPPPAGRPHHRSRSQDHSQTHSRPRSGSHSHSHSHASRPPSSRAQTTPTAPQYSRTYSYAMNGPPAPQPIPVPPALSYPRRSSTLPPLPPLPPLSPMGSQGGPPVVQYYDPRRPSTIPAPLPGQTYVIVQPKPAKHSHSSHPHAPHQQAPLLKRLLTSFAAPFSSTPSPANGHKGRRLRRRSSY